MRILLDMQGAQTESRLRGIGRYTLALAQAIARNAREHEVWLLLSDLFPDTVLPLREQFAGLVPAERIVVFSAPGPVAEKDPANATRARVAELVREHAIAGLQPDIVHVSSLFEGYTCDAAVSVGSLGTGVLTSVTVHDLIPLLNPGQFLGHDLFRAHYLRKIESLKRADLIIAVSESAAREATQAVGIAPSRVVSASEGTDERFRPTAPSPEEDAALLSRLGLIRPFVLHIGALEPRKNFHGLVRAYAKLQPAIHRTHQLLLVAQGDASGRVDLHRLALAEGLRATDVAIVDRVNDDDLITLLNRCRLFVFPSLHEGFGLPPLEAMACGAATIGSNTSSIPEVIGRSDALFEPSSPASIADLMQRALTDEAFHRSLREHALRQAAKFSWDGTAKRALSAFEAVLAERHQPLSWLTRSMASQERLRLLADALSTMPDADLVLVASCVAQNALAAPERQLLLDVSEISQQDAGTGVQRVVRSYLREWLRSPPAGVRIEPIYATVDGGYRYARRFMQEFMGESTDGAEDSAVLWQRGDIFFGLDIHHHVQIAQAPFYARLRRDGVVVKFLVHDLLPIQYPQYFADTALKAHHEQWLALVAASDGAVCLSQATATALIAWLDETATRTAPGFTIHWIHNGADLGVADADVAPDPEVGAALPDLRSRPTFLCVGTLEPRKGQELLLDATELLWQQNQDVNLVFVGRPGWHMEVFIQRLRNHPEAGGRLRWFDGIDDASLEQIYGACTCLVAASLDEGFGLPLVEAARRGLPIVARNVPVFREIAGDHGFYFDGYEGSGLAGSLTTWLSLHAQGRHPRPDGIRWSTWRESAERLGRLLTHDDYPRRQLLVDVSEIARRDVGTGIQRVVRNVLAEWLRCPPVGWRVEPVYAEPDAPYRYARSFKNRFLGQPGPLPDDDLIEHAPGDLFFVLDLRPEVQVAHRDTFRALRRHGVSVKFLVHDLLPVQLPHLFSDVVSRGFADWLRVLAEADGAVCVSRSTADELRRWLRQNAPRVNVGFSIDWSHNGADLQSGISGSPAATPTASAEERLRGQTTFLMVGTLEPRKGHGLVLDAFEQLWRDGLDVNLIIVGKQGWLADSLAGRLRSHAQHDQRLLWLYGICDDELETLYATTHCLIAASEGEGFGLPLVEAACRKLPIIARDIPVFREVAGEHAYYFDSTTGDGLAQAITDWLELYQKGAHPPSEGIRWLTWEQSATRLAERLLPAAT
jgi:glycosyltransferase involved in cell wall biosynthesis